MVSKTEKHVIVASVGTYLYVTCCPPVYTEVLDHAATAPQLPELGADVVGALLVVVVGEGPVPVPVHALTANTPIRQYLCLLWITDQVGYSLALQSPSELLGVEDAQNAAYNHGGFAFAFGIRVNNDNKSELTSQIYLSTNTKVTYCSKNTEIM